MISTELLLYCIGAAGAYLFVLSVIWEYAGTKMNINRGIPAEILEPISKAWFMMNFVMELLLYVVIPALVYSYFYIMLPLSGIRTGVAGALFAFTLGAVPAIVGLLTRTRLPALLFSYLLFGVLLKLAGCLVIIGYLYQL